MYIPSSFQELNADRIDALVRDHDFASLISVSGDVPVVTQVPLLWDRATMTLSGHLASANPHAALLLEGTKVMAVFHGPHGYVSPTWYKDENPAVPNVPTWNYATVHMHGRVRRIDDAEGKFALVQALTRAYEGDHTDSWRPAPAAGSEVRMRAIVGFRIAVEQIEAKFKLSQNRSAADRASVIASLEERGGDHDRAMADWMRKV